MMDAPLPHLPDMPAWALFIHMVQPQLLDMVPQAQIILIQEIIGPTGLVKEEFISLCLGLYHRCPGPRPEPEGP